MLSRELRYGFIAGFITLLWMACGYVLRWQEQEIGRYAPFLSLIILIAATYITILHKRDKDGGGGITFKDAFIAGISVSFVVGLLVGIFLMIYTQYVNPNYVNEVVKQTEEYLKTQKATQEQIDKAIEGTRATYSAFGQLTYGIGTTMLTGVLITLVCAAVMRREKKAEV